MIRRALAWLGTVRVTALLGLVVIAATTGYWWHINTLFPEAGWQLGMLTIGYRCDAYWAMAPDRVVILDRPYTLVMSAIYHTGYPSPPPHCTVTVAVSAPQFDVSPAEVQSVDLAEGESANLTWTLTPRQAGTHTITIDWPYGREASTRHAIWRVGVIDSAFERMVGLIPRQIQSIGWVLGIGLLLPYFLAPLYRALRGRPAFPERSRAPE